MGHEAVRSLHVEAKSLAMLAVLHTSSAGLQKLPDANGIIACTGARARFLRSDALVTAREAAGR
jgi:hypothetical protein